MAYFVYELAHEPTSLFKNGLMRKANKALLAQAIKKDVRFTDTVANPKCVVALPVTEPKCVIQLLVTQGCVVCWCLF